MWVPGLKLWMAFFSRKNGCSLLIYVCSLPFCLLPDSENYVQNNLEQENKKELLTNDFFNPCIMSQGKTKHMTRDGSWRIEWMSIILKGHTSVVRDIHVPGNYGFNNIVRLRRIRGMIIFPLSTVVFLTRSNIIYFGCLMVFYSL